jgi:hypothetical protein
MDLTDFIEIMDAIGFDLIKYYSDVYHREETGLSPLANIVNDKEMELTYSGCWYGGLFFKWLFKTPSKTTKIVNPWKITHGYLSSDQECHYFVIITTDNQGVIFNTYGGITNLIINELSLNKINKLLKRITKNDVLAFELLFGITPNYNEMVIEELELEESIYKLPTEEQLFEKIDDLIYNAYTIEDRDELHRIKNIIM